jgi:FkbM family methyltransferase
MLKDLPDSHDSNTISTVMGYCDSFDTAIDVGAHRGIWTSRLCNFFTKVWAFEPTELHKLIDSRALVIPVAVGEKLQSCSMLEGSENTGQTYVTSGEDINMVSLDSIEFLFKENINLIKIDVEGYEKNVLLGATNLLQLNKPVVVIEENGLSNRYGVRLGEAGEYLNSLGATRIDVINKDWVYKWL